MEHVISAATSVLDRYWDMTLPVNPTALAYCMGTRISFDPDINQSGTVSIGRAGVPEIFLNPRDSMEQQRFAIFRGLGELVLNDPEPESSRSSLPETKAFAAEMILPRKAVALFGANRMPIQQMAGLFGVTEAAMRIRLERMGFGTAYSSS